MNIKAENKINILSNTLSEFFGDKMNLARMKFFGLFISALCKVQTVCFEKLPGSFDSDVKMDSSLRRIQRFMSEYVFDTDLIARFVFSMLPHKPPYRLVLDRTNWKFGSKDINVLVLAIVYKGDAFPLQFLVMPKFGNSCTRERIEVINRFFRLFGIKNVEYLLADREFEGQHWLAYLNGLGIEYHIRIRENFQVEIPRNGHCVKAFKALKTRGFNIEDTHLTDIERISKLFSLVLIAFAWVYKAGIYLNEFCQILVDLQKISGIKRIL